MELTDASPADGVLCENPAASLEGEPWSTRSFCRSGRVFGWRGRRREAIILQGRKAKRVWLPAGVKHTVVRLAVRLPMPLRSGLAWLSQARFTVGVSGVVLNERDEMLLLRHRFRKSHAWGLPGGFVERGEELEDALRRELYEETGYTIEILSHISTRMSHVRHLDVSYLARIGAGTLEVDTTEIIEARFFPLSDLPPGLSREQLKSIRPVLDAAAAKSRGRDT